MKVFISHSSSDKRFVRTLKTDLNANGIQTFVDEDSLEFGDSLKEKLEIALDDSSHFIIVLTENATNSNWVKFELKEALNLFDKKTLAKIIPIKYRPCDLPKEISDLIYADLSEEIVQVNNDKIKFLSDGYDVLLGKLIKTLNASERRLNKTDKTEIKKETEETEKTLDKKPITNFIAFHPILRYQNSIAVDYYAKRVVRAKGVRHTANLFPILLPSIYKPIFINLAIGDELFFTIDNVIKYKCYFAGYRTTGPEIVMQVALRRVLKINLDEEYSFSVELKSRTFQKLGS